MKMRKVFSLLFVAILVATFVGCGAKPHMTKGSGQKSVPQTEAKVKEPGTDDINEFPPTLIVKVNMEKRTVVVYFPLLSPDKFGENPQFALYAAYAYHDKADSTWAAVEQDNYGIETTQTAEYPGHLRGVISLTTDSEAEFFTIRVEGREENSGQILLVWENDMSSREDESGEPGCEFGLIAKTGKVIVPVQE